MSFFDDLGKSIDKTGRTIANKASGLVDSTKLNHQISQEERAMDEVYRQIGIAYFGLYGNAPAEQLAPMCDEIRRKMELLASLRQQELTARGKRLCQNCGCESVHKKKLRPEEEKHHTALTCPRCGSIGTWRILSSANGIDTVECKVCRLSMTTPSEVK